MWMYFSLYPTPGGISIAGVLQKKGALGEHCRSNLRPLRHFGVTRSHMFFMGALQSLVMGMGVTVVPLGPFHTREHLGLIKFGQR